MRQDVQLQVLHRLSHDKTVTDIELIHLLVFLSFPQWHLDWGPVARICKMMSNKDNSFIALCVYENKAYLNIDCASFDTACSKPNTYRFCKWSISLHSATGYDIKTNKCMLSVCKYITYKYTSYMFWPLVWPFPGRHITKDRYTEIL